MSNALAIAAVTATLRNLINRRLNDDAGSGSVTAKPPDKARDNREGTNQINLFLYRTHHNNGFQSGRHLALNLYYLVTAYGQNDDDILAHQLLGLAMQTLHEFPVLNPADIRTALGESDLQNQVEKVKISPLSLNLEEISKMWSTFQTQYRISAAYEATVVLIDSRRKGAALPVLSIGSRLTSGKESGIQVFGNATAPQVPFPTLTSTVFPSEQTSLQLGQSFVLRGYQLSSTTNTQVQFKHTLRTTPIELATTTTPEGDLQVTLAPSNNPWLAGSYTLSVTGESNGSSFTTNALPFSLAPTITLATQTLTANNRQLTLDCQPPVWLWRRSDRPDRLRGQTVSLLVDQQELLPLPDSLPELDKEPTQVDPQPSEQVTSLTFDLSKVSPGSHFVRLRVDGIDSLIIDWSASPIAFDPQQQVTVQ
ncbi:MAG: DUF4255 domain-containing protein [Cyanobacteria bacterium J06560_2]